MDSPETMPNDVNQSGTSLRQKAEAQLEVKNSETKTHQGFTTVKLSNAKESETDPMRLLHELEVHQIELEMQNEDLKLAVDKAATATALYDFAPAGYFTLNHDGLICQLNLSGAKLLGKERSGLIDSHFSQFIVPESLPVFNDFFLKIFQPNTRQVCELWLVLQGNPSFFIHLEGIVSGEPEKCLLTAVNITEHKQAEQIIAESESNLNSLINNRDESIWSIDSSYNFVIFNNFFLDEYFASFSIELKKGMNALKNVSPKMSELWKEKYDRALKGKRVYFEYSNHVGKELHYYEVFLNPIISDEKISGVSALSANISYRKRAEAQLRESEYFFKESQHAAFIGSFKFDLMTEYWNSSEVFDKIFGIEKSYPKGIKGWINLVHPEDRGMMFHYLRVDIISKKKSFNKEYRIIRISDGVTRWVHGMGKPEYDTDGNVISMIGTIQDITDRKLAEEALKQSEARLKELNATKDKFFSIIAHDLKNPFNSIIGFSNILERQIAENNYEGIAKYGIIIQNSSQRAMDLLMNLLEWSRLQTESIAFNPECIEIVELMNSILKSLLDSANQKTIVIITEFPPLAFVYADKEMLSTVLRNLISNAIKFTHPVGKIVISAEKKQAEWMITIADNGVGIKKEAIDKLFRIDQSYSTLGTQNEKGTGLGLLLCKEFIEKNGGRIWIESEEGGPQGSSGSKFHFTVPKG